MASLILLTGPRSGLRHPLLQDRIVLGRDPACDLVIDESMRKGSTRVGQKSHVSRRHAILTCASDGWSIEDGDGPSKKPSYNGTYLNDHKLPPFIKHRLKDRDRIRICDATFQFQEDSRYPFTVEATVEHGSSDHSLSLQPAEKLRLLLEISNSLRSTLDIDSVLQQMVDQLLVMFAQADRAFLIMKEVETGPLVVRVFRARDGSDPHDHRFSSSIVRRCLENVEAILGDDLPRQFPDTESVDLLTVCSLICAPLWSQDGRAIGAIQLDTRAQNRLFRQDDLQLLLGVASQASIAINNVRLHQEALVLQQRMRDLKLAHEVQHALLPRSLPGLAGYEFFAHYQSAEQVGGDYYDFIELPGNRLAVLLGDVFGKGVPAALVMTKFSVEARVCLETEPDLARAVTRLNALMSRAAVLDLYVTLVALILEPASHTIAIVNAGHLSPRLRRFASGAIEETSPPEIAGLPVGVLDGEVYSARTISLEPGDVLVLFSDGVSEAINGEDHPFGTEGVHTVLRGPPRSPHAVGNAILQAVQQHTTGCHQFDDITMVCFGRMTEESW